MDPIFHAKNITLIINILIENDFPLKFIFDTINNKIKDITRKKISRTNNLENNKKSINSSWFIVYVPILTEKFKQFNK